MVELQGLTDSDLFLSLIKLKINLTFFCITFYTVL